MLFITNRGFNEGVASQEGRSVTFDLSNNTPLNSVYYCERADDGSIVELMRTPFMGALRDSGHKQIVLYIHGFSNLPDSVFERAQRYEDLLNNTLTDAGHGDTRSVEVVPMIWPCDNDLGIVKDYWDDQDAAEASKYAFSRAIGHFFDWRDDDSQPECLKRINIMAHSMGNRVLRYTLDKWSHDYGAINGVFRNIFLVAADIANESLEHGEPGHSICLSARNVVVYHANDDLALRSSKASNLRNRVVTRRLGHTGPESMFDTPDNVFAIDCDNFNNKYDKPKGHSYFIDKGAGGPTSPVLRHMTKSLINGRVDVPAGEREMILEEGYVI